MRQTVEDSNNPATLLSIVLMVEKMRRKIAICFTSLLLMSPTGAFAQQLQLPPQIEVPEGIDIARRRAELFALLPQLPSPITLSGLKNLAQQISNFEQGFIEGLRLEILQVCKDAKSFERQINQAISIGAISSQTHDYYTDYIFELRAECDSRNADSSSYWALEASLRRQNTLIFQSLQQERARCDQRQSCYEN